MLKDLGGSGPQRQIVLLSAIGAILCAAMVAGYFYFLRTPYQVLFANLRTSDAATIVAELGKKKIPYRIEDGGKTILVPADLVEDTRLGVAGQDLPLKGMVGFELFNKSDMGVTEFAQKINYQRALQGELARTIMSLDSVDTARIHLSLPEETIFRDDKKPAKASVTVQARPGSRVTASTVRGIQRLIAAGVPDLDPLQVVVLDARGTILSGEAALETSTVPGSERKRIVEQYYEAQVRQAIAQALPAAEADVRVWAGPAVAAESGMGMSRRDPNFDAWTPGRRDFRLFAAVSVAKPLSVKAEEEIEALAAAAIGRDAAIGDVVNVSVTGPAAEEPSQPEIAASPVRLSPSARTPDSEGWSPGLLDLVLALVLIAIVALIVRGRARTGRSLTEEQRSDYVSRFKTLLEREDANAPAV